MSFQRKTPMMSSNWQRSSNFSARNNQRPSFASSGLPSIDSVLGGGIRVGSVVLIEEDQTGGFAEIIFKYFLSEGISSRSGLFVGSMKNISNIMKELPGLVPDSEAIKQSEEVLQKTNEEGLKIAWQYRNLPEVRTCTSAASSPFDLSHNMPADMVEAAKPRIFSINDCEKNRSYYTQLIIELQKYVEMQLLEAADKKSSPLNLMRVGLLSLGSSLWDHPADDATTFCKFLYCLRAMVRSLNATCLLTVPVHLMERMLVKRIEKLCDAVIRLESFADSAKDTNPIFKDYQGLFYVIKVPTLNTLHSYRPTSTDFAFKLRRRKFTIEVLHLPPELPETTSRSQEDMFDDGPTSSGLGCGHTRTKSKIDF